MYFDLLLSSFSLRALKPKTMLMYSKLFLDFFPIFIFAKNAKFSEKVCKIRKRIFSKFRIFRKVYVGWKPLVHFIYILLQAEDKFTNLKFKLRTQTI